MCFADIQTIGNNPVIGNRYVCQHRKIRGLILFGPLPKQFIDNCISGSVKDYPLIVVHSHQLLLGLSSTMEPMKVHSLQTNLKILCKTWKIHQRQKENHWRNFKPKRESQVWWKKIYKLSLVTMNITGDRCVGFWVETWSTCTLVTLLHPLFWKFAGPPIPWEHLRCGAWKKSSYSSYKKWCKCELQASEWERATGRPSTI